MAEQTPRSLPAAAALGLGACADCGAPATHRQGGEAFCCRCFERQVDDTLLLLDRARGQLEKLKALAAALAQELK